MYTSNSHLTLVSHTLCPYVQRGAISLAEKGVSFRRIYVDLANKPDWFVEKSPLGKVPVLLVGEGDQGVAIFESSVILEYLEETQPHPLHPQDPLTRAQHRSWIEFGSEILNNIARFYNAADRSSFAQAEDELHAKMARLEVELTRRQDTFFLGEKFCLVDTVYAPIFRYFDVFEDRISLYLLRGFSAVDTWRGSLRERPSVQNAVDPEYPQQLAMFLKNRQSYISGLIK